MPLDPLDQRGAETSLDELRARDAQCRWSDELDEFAAAAGDCAYTPRIVGAGLA